MSAIAIPQAGTALYDYPKYWAECYGRADFLPVSRAEMDALGWDSCDIIIVTGDAYVDQPSFGMAVIGRLLEAQGFRRHHRAARLARKGPLLCARKTQPVFRGHRRQHGLHDQSLHGGPQTPLR